MTEVFQGRMSAAPQSQQRVAALADWIAALPPAAASPSADAALVQRGQQLFESREVGCATCHSGTALSDFALHDVGTSMAAVKTPSLRGVSKRMPLMHDGCATSMLERFEPSCGGGDQHGVTSQLNQEDLGALAAYLESL